MITKAKRLERLKELQKMLKNHDKIFGGVKFDIHRWAFSKDMPSEKIEELNKKNRTIECATAACALGSAGLYDKFRKQGLKTVISAYGGADIYFGHEDSFEAGAVFFGISYPESNWLFDADSYRDKNLESYDYKKGNKRITPDAVAVRVKHLITHYQKTSEPLLKNDFNTYGEAPLPYDYYRMGLSDYN